MLLACVRLSCLGIYGIQFSGKEFLNCFFSFGNQAGWSKLQFLENCFCKYYFVILQLILYLLKAKCKHTFLFTLRNPTQTLINSMTPCLIKPFFYYYYCEGHCWFVMNDKNMVYIVQLTVLKRGNHYIHFYCNFDCNYTFDLFDNLRRSLYWDCKIAKDWTKPQSTTTASKYNYDILHGSNLINSSVIKIYIIRPKPGLVAKNGAAFGVAKNGVANLGVAFFATGPGLGLIMYCISSRHSNFLNITLTFIY